MLFNFFGETAAKEKELAKPRPQAFELEVNGSSVPVRILTERRMNSRVTVNPRGILIRVSRELTHAEQQKQIDQFLKWAKEKIAGKPQLLQNLPVRSYVDNEILQVGKHLFRINLVYHDAQSSKAKIGGNNIVLMLAKGLTTQAENETKSYLVSRCLIKYFQPLVSARIHELNDKYFQKPLHQVRLKYNVSNWGSCLKNKGLITISVRLMFAPDEVIDYVYLHELAHLIEPNHSDRFWKIVEQVMPNYQSAEKHLSAHNMSYYL